MPAKKRSSSKDYEWAVIRKVGKYYLYVEWEGWEGFTGTWLPSDQLRRDNPLMGVAAPVRKGKRKPATIPPEPDAPGAAPEPDAVQDSNGKARRPGMRDDGENLGEKIKVAPRLVIDLASATDKPKPSGPAYDPVVDRDPSLTPLALVPSADNAPLTLGAALDGSAIQGDSLFTFGPSATTAAIIRQRDGAPIVVKLDLATGKRLGAVTLPKDRKVIAVSPDGTIALTTAGFWGDYNELWNIADESPKLLSSFVLGGGESSGFNNRIEGAIILLGGQTNASSHMCAAITSGHELLLLDLSSLLATSSAAPSSTTQSAGLKGGTPQDGTSPSAKAFPSPATNAPLPIISRVVTGLHLQGRPAHCPDPHFFIAPGNNSANLFRRDGTLVASVDLSAREPFAFSPDGKQLTQRRNNTVLDLTRGSKHKTTGGHSNLQTLLEGDLALSTEGDLVNWRTNRLVWRYRLGDASSPEPLSGIYLAGRVWSYDADAGTLKGNILPTAEALAAAKAPSLPDLAVPLAGKKIALELHLDPSEDAAAAKALLTKAITDIKAVPVETGGNYLLKVASRRDNVKRTFTFDNLRMLTRPGQTAPPPPAGPQTVDCPTNQVSLNLLQADKSVWTANLFAGAGGYIQVPQGTDLQSHVNALMRPADDLLKTAQLPSQLRDPATDARITTYLPE